MRPLTLYVARFQRAGVTDQWTHLAASRWAMMAWVLMTFAQVDPDTIEVWPYGS